MKRRSSLRGRLTAWFTLLLISFGLIGGLGAYLAAQEDPDNFLDNQMREIALDVVGSVDDLAQMPAPPLKAADMIVVQAWDAHGRLLKSFPPGFDLPQQPKTGFASFQTPEGEWRSYTWVLDDGTVQVSQRALVRRTLALKAALPAIITTLLLIPMSWLLVRWLVSRILSPVDQLADQLLARQSDSTQQLTAPDVPREIEPLVGAMNEALARVQETLAAQRRFVSNAAHQLRTPLTALRIQVRNLRQLPDSVEAARVLDEMELGLRRMAALTGQLLALARAEALPAAEVSQPPLLSDVLQEAAAGVVSLAQSKRISLASAEIPLVQIKAERHDLVMLLSNLLDNAIRYTPAGGQVEIALAPDEQSLTVEIADSGPGIPEEMLSRVFDPFVRGSDEQEGTGLGLSIVKALAARSGALVRLCNKPDGSGLVARVELPIILGS
jgi:two-component system OmpR family sensor kinase